ncbi:MAG TPA: metallophosphoesterase [Terriglobales bacterium]|nr:metallophosphoesterase [Terriglobales bacterium]
MPAVQTRQPSRQPSFFPQTPRILTQRSAPKGQNFGKSRRPFGDPVADPKDDPYFEPPPVTNNVNLTLPLVSILPDADTRIAQSGQLVFHSVGDTGGIHGDDVQRAISDAMEAQITKAGDGAKPMFFYDLGDVIYFNGQSTLYKWQFYEPYQYYPAPIFAIPGNHDGDIRVRKGDPIDTEPTLYGFIQNFCDTFAHHDYPYRDTMTQPYVYWTLETPLLNIIGLYSNVEGSLDARGTNEQQAWLEDQMKNAPADRWLLVTVHHPPFSLDSSHGGCPDILSALDRAIEKTRRIPDAILSGHVHNYQRFSRKVGKQTVPYLVAGAGGYANTDTLMHKLQRKAGQPIKTPFTTTLQDVTLENYNEDNPGFLRVTADKKHLTFEYFVVPFKTPTSVSLFDSVTV